MPLPTADPYVPGHGDPAWSASHYGLDLSYAVEGNRLRGEARIKGVALERLERIVLDLAGLSVSKLLLDGKQPKWSHRGGRVVVTPRSALKKGERFALRIVYGGSPRPLVMEHHGDAGWEELTDGVIVAGRPHGSPTWFPCNDRPSDKASYTISVTTPPGYLPIANGVLVEHRRHGSAETFVYEQEEPLAPYLATVQIGRYELRELSSAVPMAVAASPSARGVAEAFGRQPEMLRAFEEMFGPYPFATYTAVVTDDALEIPLESQSLSTFGSNFLTGEWRYNRLVAHELAHQWFGNAVTVAAWKDIWLHEGFACYAEWLWSEHAGLGSAGKHAREHHRRLAGLPQDLLLSDPGPELMFDDRVYKRGALTLHALRLSVGDEAFFGVLREWVKRFSGASVSTADFTALVAELVGDQAGLFDAWLDALPLPALPA